MDFSNPALRGAILVFCSGALGEKLAYVIPPQREDWNPLLVRSLLEADGNCVSFVDVERAEQVWASGNLNLDELTEGREVVGVRVAYEATTTRKRGFHLNDQEWDGGKLQKRPHLERGGFYKGKRGKNTNFRGR